jgi:stage II sporulation protein D
VAATKGQVVTYGGQPVTTYFFSTSGGETEDIENSFVGSQPKPWLKAVDDPFDSVSPKHRWGPFRFTGKQLKSKLRRYLKGSFKRIKVLQRGVSPRVVRAQIVGTGGVTNVTGPQLRNAFSLYDTWAFFTSVTTKASKTKKPTQSTPSGDPTGGLPAARAAAADAGRIEGTIAPARRGQWLTVQRLVGTRWVRAVDAHVQRGGRYSVAVPAPGVYRVVYGKAIGDTVRLP